MLRRRPFVPPLSILLLLAASAARPEVVQDGVAATALYADGEEIRALEATGGLLSRRTGAPLRLRRMRGLADDGWVATGRRSSAAGEELVILEQSGGEWRELPSPVDPGTGFQGWGVPLVAADHLVGLAWLEGDEQTAMSVRAARWTGAGWTDVDTVAAPTSGTQTALDGTVLADGSWLLVWSAFDGEDDEILWSVRRQGSWSTPEPLHRPNSVPDVVPAVISTPAGALVAWSRFDGNDYRLRVARLADPAAPGWTEAERSGDRGTLFPSFLRTPRGVALLVRSEAPEQWTLTEIDPATARPRRRAVLPSVRLDRPLVRLEPDGVVFAWPRADRRVGETSPGLARLVPWTDPP